MSAQTQLPSEKLLKLKQLLEKEKLSFYSQNSDLSTFFQDRNFKIENLGKIDQNETANSKISANSVEVNVVNQFLKTEKNKHQLETKISLEEFTSIFEKLEEFMLLPAGQLESESELYLEQQLSDLLGFEVTAELEEHRLNHSTGIMRSESHLKRTPNDELPSHTEILEAGIDKSRSAFGWFVNHGEITSEAEYREKYFFSLQLYQLINWKTEAKELKKWYKFRKMIVINPAEKIAIVGVVGNIDHRNQFKEQFGGSPELIRYGKIWSLKSQGKVLLMFVDDPKNVVPLGPIYFDSLIHINESN